MRKAKLITSLHMQALEYRQRWLLLLIVLLMPAVLFASNYYSVPAGDPQPLEVPSRSGSITLQVDSRETWPMTIGIMGVVWGVSTVGFFGVVGNLRKDRRLLLCGYRAWQILLARLGLLAGLSVPLALIGMLPYTMISSSLHPVIVWLACLLAALIAAGFGLLIGILLPRPMEGLLLIILGTGIGMSLAGDSARYFFLYPAMQLLVMGRLSPDPWPYSYAAQSLMVAAAFVVLALAVWWWRTRLPQREAVSVQEPPSTAFAGVTHEH
jgi:hypothetical protein